jgi:hypothetical protein
MNVKTFIQWQLRSPSGFIILETCDRERLNKKLRMIRERGLWDEDDMNLTVRTNFSVTATPKELQY